LREAIFALFGVMLLLGVGVAAIQSEYQDSVRGGGIQENFDRETVTASYSTPVNVSASNVPNRVYDESVDVYDNTSTLVQPDGNYSWNEDGFGRLNISSSASAISDGESIEVTYGYNKPTGAQETAKTAATIPAQAGDALVILFVAFVFFGAFLVVMQNS